VQLHLHAGEMKIVLLLLLGLTLIAAASGGGSNQVGLIYGNFSFTPMFVATASGFPIRSKMSLPDFVSGLARGFYILHLRRHDHIPFDDGVVPSELSPTVTTPAMWTVLLVATFPAPPPRISRYHLRRGRTVEYRAFKT